MFNFRTFVVSVGFKLLDIQGHVNLTDGDFYMEFQTSKQNINVKLMRKSAGYVVLYVHLDRK